MPEKLAYTGERTSKEIIDNPIYQRLLFAYHWTKPFVKDKIVLEVGCGDGYGSDLLSESARIIHAIDKSEDVIRYAKKRYPSKKIQFHAMQIPPIAFSDDTFDLAFAFQLIEHLDHPEAFLEEVHRTMKPGAQLLITTPNRHFSLAPNPYHVKEYSAGELRDLLSRFFSKAEVSGLFGDDEFMEYHKSNRSWVDRFMRFDVFGLVERLPKGVLQKPYDIITKAMRKNLHKSSTALTENITLDNFFIDTNNMNRCMDLYAVATK